MDWSIVTPGMTLTPNGFSYSDATVKDAKSVSFKDETMSFNVGNEGDRMAGELHL
jgi:hypothetical protein